MELGRLQNGCLGSRHANLGLHLKREKSGVAVVLIVEEQLRSLGASLGLDVEVIEKISTCRQFAMYPLLPASPVATLSFVTSQEIANALPTGGSNLWVLAPSHVDVPYPINKIVVADPSVVFWSLVHAYNSVSAKVSPSVIDSTARIHPTAQVAELGVEIAENVSIGPGAVIRPGVQIENNCIIGGYCQIGNDGFMVKDTFSARVRISHDAGVKIASGVILGAGVVVDAGLFGMDTEIARNTAVDSGVHIAHAVSLGARNIVAAGAKFGGWVATGDDVFVGLGAVVLPRVTIGDGAYVGAGAVVAKSVKKHSRQAARPSVEVPQNFS